MGFSTSLVLRKVSGTLSVLSKSLPKLMNEFNIEKLYCVSIGTCKNHFDCLPVIISYKLFFVFPQEEEGEKKIQIHEESSAHEC